MSAFFRSPLTYMQLTVVMKIIRFVNEVAAKPQGYQVDKVYHRDLQKAAVAITYGT